MGLDHKKELEPVSSSQLLRVGVLLSGREQFSPFYGGALARWIYEVYNRLRDRIEVTVFGFPTPVERHASPQQCGVERLRPDLHDPDLAPLG